MYISPTMMSTHFICI